MRSSTSVVVGAGEEKEIDEESQNEDNDNASDKGDYEQALEIDPQINPINEVYNLKENASQSIYETNVVNFFCVLAVSDLIGTSTRSDRFLLAAQYYKQLVDTESSATWPKKACAEETIWGMRHTTDVNNQPFDDGILEFTAEELQYANTFLMQSGLPFGDIESQEAFGQRIWSRYNSCQRYCNNNINKWWRPVESGENLSQVLHGMLKRLWEEKQIDTTKNTLYRKWSRINEGTSALTTDQQAFVNTLQEYVNRLGFTGPDAEKNAREEMAHDMALAKPFDRKWRPNEWLAYLAFGPPAIVEFLSLFTTGRAKDRLITAKNAVAASKKAGEENRDPNANSKSGQEMISSTQMYAHHTRHERPIDRHCKKMKILWKSIRQAEKRNLPEDFIKGLQDRYDRALLATASVYDEEEKLEEMEKLENSNGGTGPTRPSTTLQSSRGTRPSGPSTTLENEGGTGPSGPSTTLENEGGTGPATLPRLSGSSSSSSSRSSSSTRPLSSSCSSSSSRPSSSSSSSGKRPRTSAEFNAALRRRTSLG